MNDNTNLLLLAALGAGGFWLYQDREKHKRAAEDARDALSANRAPTVESAVYRAPQQRTEPQGRTQRYKLASRSYDSLFAEYGHGIPVAYLRALALHESGLNPRATDGPAWGLLQVVEVVRKDYNGRQNTNYERRDLLDPSVNVAIASEVLVRIIDGYQRFHPEAPNLQPDWQNPLFVELLTFGWNAGMSERGGVGRVATYLSRRGFVDFTIDDIARAAKDAGASPHLSNERKVAFAKKVTTQYLRERARDEAEGYRVDEPLEPAPVVAVASVPPPDGPVTSPDQVDPKPTGGV